MIKGKFIDNLPKVYGIYTGGFIGFIILMAIGDTTTLADPGVVQSLVDNRKNI